MDLISTDEKWPQLLDWLQQFGSSQPQLFVVCGDFVDLIQEKRKKKDE